VWALGTGLHVPHWPDRRIRTITVETGLTGPLKIPTVRPVQRSGSRNSRRKLKSLLLPGSTGNQRRTTNRSSHTGNMVGFFSSFSGLFTWSCLSETFSQAHWTSASHVYPVVRPQYNPPLACLGASSFLLILNSLIFLPPLS
jgi:hypothetical protein